LVTILVTILKNEDSGVFRKLEVIGIWKPIWKVSHTPSTENAIPDTLSEKWQIIITLINMIDKYSFNSAQQASRYCLQQSTNDNDLTVIG
jgi:hypothetical protein